MDSTTTPQRESRVGWPCRKENPDVQLGGLTLPRDQHATSPPAVLNRCGRRLVSGTGLPQRDVADTLMGTARVVVLEVLSDQPTQVPLAEWHHAREQLAPDAANEPLGESIQVRRKRRQLDRLNPSMAKHIACLFRKDRIVVQDEVSLVTQESVEVVGEFAEDVGAPQAVALLHDPTEGDDSGLEIDDEENLVAHKPLLGEDLNVEEVGGTDMTHVGAKERRPRVPASRLGLDALLAQVLEHGDMGDSVAELLQLA